MSFQTLLDSLPITGVFFAFAVIALGTYEICFRVGRWWQEKTPNEKEGPSGTLVGALLGLMAFLLAVTMGMAADRFGTRRDIVLAEANSVGTTYLRAGYLPEPAASTSRNLLREYVPLRIGSGADDLTSIGAKIARSAEIQTSLWSMAEELARATPESDVLALYIESLNETIDLHETRVVAALYVRVPETILFLLIIGSALALGMVGYNAGLARQRGVLAAVSMVAALGAVVTLVVDLDRPQDGFLRVSQQPLLDLQQQIGPPLP